MWQLHEIMLGALIQAHKHLNEVKGDLSDLWHD